MGLDARFLDSMRWRSIGPPRGGRVVAVSGDQTDPSVFWFGACAGGVWKSTDAGTYWRNVSDGFFNTAAVGAIAVAPSDGNVVYAGTGESCTRNDVSHGDGVYRTDDGGRTWRHLGLEATRHISRVRVHPTNPDVAWVAALGDIFGPNPERGVYMTRDGGAHWDLVLHTSDKAGAADLIVDPRNPRILYAALWEARRTPWSMESGGPGSSLHRSIDGGRSWEDITTKPGLPKESVLKGRMGVAVAPAKPGRVWAVVEAAEGKGGLYRSENGGELWERISEDPALLGRPWYYMHLVADPQDPETLYSLNFGFHRSTDGGRHFVRVPTPHGDNHDLWIDPQDSSRMIEGNDGGACVTLNAGWSWSSIYNQPTGQFYHVATDNRWPYRVYGTQQDNSAISVPTRSRKGAITWGDCFRCGTSESGHIVVDPKDDDVVYSGAVGSSAGGGGTLLRYDHRTEEMRNVTVWPEYFFGEGPEVLKHRFQWTYPIAFSPHDPDVLYCAGERVFRSTDGGAAWEAISPDLTRNDASKLGPSGGPITKDTSGAEHYCTIFAFAESPIEKGLLWAGSDDGLVHVSRDAGGTWREVTPPELPEWSTVTVVEPSPHAAGTAYVCALRYKLQDRKPYLFKTTDYGDSWKLITGSLPDGEFTRVVRADPVRPGLLYAGTETRAYVSLDDGGSWERLTGDLPVVPVYDIVVKDTDLVAATHGRGFYVLDDITPLRELTDADVQLFTPPAAYRYPMPRLGSGPEQATYMMGAGGAAFVTEKLPDDETRHVFLDAGQNPPDGVVVSFALARDVPHDQVELSFLDESGLVLATFSPQEPEAPADGLEPGGVADAAAAGEREPAADKTKTKKWHERLPHTAGIHRFNWRLRGPGPKPVPDDKGEAEEQTGYLVPPGTYTARLRAGEQTLERTFEVRADPRSRATNEDLQAQYELLTTIRDRLTQTNEAIGRLRLVKRQVESWSKRSDQTTEAITQQAKDTAKKLSEIESKLTQTKIVNEATRLSLPAGLDRKLAEIPAVVASADARPPAVVHEVFGKINSQIGEALAELDAVIDTDVAALNQAIAAAGVAAIVTAVPPQKDGA